MKENWHRSVRRLLFILLLFAVLLFALEVWFADHTSNIVGFYAGIGFLSCVALIVVALLIGKIIKRKDNYYGY